MHGKELVLAPMLQDRLGVKCFTSDRFDTDFFGTFSGEIERKDSALKTLRKKCLKAMEMCKCDLGIASEGSFGSHPTIPFIPANEEFLILIDLKNDLEIIGRNFSIETNYAQEEVKTWQEVVEFAKRVLFPSPLILRNSENAEIIDKGITDWDVLKTSFKNSQKISTSLIVETDMRALYNPTRMKEIKKAGKNLVDNIESCCPDCHAPGFNVILASPGLPCNLCSLPTKSTLSYIYQCKKCSFQKEEKFPHGKNSEDPMYCDTCNP